MAYRFEFDPARRIVRSRFTNQVDDDQLSDYYRTASLLLALLAPDVGITDLSQATSSVTSEMVRALAKLPPAMPVPSRPRFIVASSDHLYGLARMFQMVGESTRPNLQVIRSADQVFSILGIEKPEFEPISKAFGPGFSIPQGIWEERD